MRGEDAQVAPRGKAARAKVFPKENLPESDCADEQSNGSMEGSLSAADAIRIVERTKQFMQTEKQEADGVRCSESTVDHSGEASKDAYPAETLGRREENETISSGFSGLKHSYDHLSCALKGYIENIVENVQFWDNVVRILSLYSEVCWRVV